MASIYRRGNVLWATLTGGVRRSLGTGNKAEARRRLRALEAQMSHLAWEPPGSHVASIATWDEAAADLLTYYESYGTRKPGEAGSRLRQLTKYFGGWKLAEIDASAILGFVSDAKRRGKAHATINVDLATLRRALRLAHEYGKLERVPRISVLKPAAPRSGFFEPEQVEMVCKSLSEGLALIVRLAFSYGWRVDSEILTLTKAQVNLHEGTLRLLSGRTKNGAGRVAYLTEELMVAMGDQLSRVWALEQELGIAIHSLTSGVGTEASLSRASSIRGVEHADRQSVRLCFVTI